MSDDKVKLDEGLIGDAINEGKTRVKDAYKVAMEKSFGKTWTDKLQVWNWPKNSLLFVGNFFKELFAVKKEKEEAKERAESEIVQEVVNGGETSAIAKRLTEEIDAEAKLEPEEKEAVAILVEDSLEAAKATGEPAKALATIDRVKEAAKEDEKDPEALTDEEIRRSFSMGLFTMVRLRQRFDSEEKLAEFLTRVKSAAGKSRKFNDFSKYLTNNFKKLFKFESGDVPELLGIDKTKFLPLLISNDKMRDGLDIVLPELFPTAVRDKGLVPIRKFFVNFIRQKRYSEPETIAKLVFMVEGKNSNDMRDLAKRIGGAKIVSLASVRETEDKKAQLKQEGAEKPVAKKEDEEKGEEADKKPDHKEEEPQLAEDL
ncbi:MAG: hypothetical protein WCX95_01670 [Candidatus Gracilibacteria bacterium]